MKILITAFEPFDNNQENYSNEILKKIETKENLKKIILPVEYFKSFEILKEEIIKESPNIIILLGEARSYPSVGFEVIAINEVSDKPDNNSLIPASKFIVKDSLDGIFSTLNYDLFKESFNKTNTKYHRSYSAGVYVCNSLMYQTLNYIKENNLNIECGFIHIPNFSKQNSNEIADGLNLYINNLIGVNNEI